MQRLIANMERWRWMPEHLGEMHIWDNIPEFMTRVFKKGQVIHTAKIIVGKPETPTAVFSANMKFLVFHPEWGVPDSIKVKELAPYLSGGGGFLFFGGGDTSVLTRQRLRVVYNGRPVDPSSVNWGSVDIRRFTFLQSAGPHNVLGVVKFMFPNKHDIYMHDTPQRELFERPVRTFSHGCIRVHNPGAARRAAAGRGQGLAGRAGARPAGARLQQRGSAAAPDPRARDLLHGGRRRGRASKLLQRHLRPRQPRAGGARRQAVAARRRWPGDGEFREARRPQRYKQTNNDFFSGLFGN